MLKLQNKRSTKPTHKRFHTPSKKYVVTYHAKFSHSTTTINAPAKVTRPRRSLLYIPGSSLKMLGKAPTSGADTVCLDLEDGVALTSKQTARENIQSFVMENRALFPSQQEISLRINPKSAGSGLYDLDVEWLNNLPFAPHSIALPKMDTVEDFTDIVRVITLLEKKHNAHIELIGMVETPIAVINLPDILAASHQHDNNHQHLTALIFGGDDYANASGATRTTSNHELAFPRGMTLMHAAAHNIGVIDIVHKEFKDLTRFRQFSQESMECGFIGTQNIHPSQVVVSNEVYSPSPALTQWAIDVTTEDKINAEKGVGAWTYKGMMIDMPTVKRAWALLDRAKACGTLPLEYLQQQKQ